MTWRPKNGNETDTWVWSLTIHPPHEQSSAGAQRARLRVERPPAVPRELALFAPAPKQANSKKAKNA